MTLRKLFAVIYTARCDDEPAIVKYVSISSCSGSSSRSYSTSVVVVTAVVLVAVLIRAVVFL